jgi:hypothetical protein
LPLDRGAARLRVESGAAGDPSAVAPPHCFSKGEDTKDVRQTSLRNPDLAAYARLCDAHGERVTDSEMIDNAPAAAFAPDGPALVEVMTDADLVQETIPSSASGIVRRRQVADE